MIGRRLGHYEIVEKLGEGGMGAVYRARDTTLGRDVALKLLPEFVAGDGEKVARLEREARLLASLSHPNVATLHGLEESNGLKYLVMELVPGETLADRKIRELLRWCLQKDPHRRLRDIGDARIESDEPSASPVAVPRRSYLPWAVAALVSGIAIWSLLRPAAEPERPVSRLILNLPPEQGLSHVNDPAVAVSPDGRRVVYVGGSGTNRMLYVRPIDQLESRPIPGTEDAVTAFFSPDGEWVGFYAIASVKLKKVRLDGGLPITLCDAQDPWGASWGTDDTILFAPGDASGLSRVSASGGAQSVVTTPDATQGETSHRWPEILPDGKSALFTILTGSSVDAARIGLLSLETGEYRVLVEGGSFARYVPTGHLVYGSERVLLAAPFDLERLELTGSPVPILEGVWTNPTFGTAHFALSRKGTLAYVASVAEERALVPVDRAGAVRPITKEHRPYANPRLSPDGQRLAVKIEDHIWIYDMARDALTRMTFGPNQEYRAIWTPDGTRLTFRRDDPPSIFWQPADGSGESERLTKSENMQLPDSWSPDGKTLVYSEWGPNGFDIGLLTLDSEPSSRPFLQTAFNEAGGVFSPDGRFLAYVSDESGRYEVYVRPFSGSGGKWLISNAGGVQPLWARNGHEILYRNGDKMMAVAVDTEPEFHAGRPVLLFEGEFYNSDKPFHVYDVTPDGQHFIMLQEVESWPTKIHVVLNWFEELKERVPVGRKVGR